MIFAVPLAWLQLTYEKSRLLVAIAGITFAVILIFMQIGFADALFRSAIRLHTNLSGDVVLISPQSTNLVGMRNFSQRRLYQALGIDGVEAVNSLYINLGAWKIKESPSGATRNILVLGADPSVEIFKLPGVDVESDPPKKAPLDLTPVQAADVVLFDSSSRAEFGPIIKEYRESLNNGGTVTREVANRKLTIGGFFELGSSFASDGTILTSDINFLRIFDNRRPGLINVGIIKLKQGSDPYEVISKLVAQLPGDMVSVNDADPKKSFQRAKDQLTMADIKKGDITTDDVRVLTMAQFVEFERGYWQKSTSIGFIFSLGTVMGFIVGVVIVYQILYTDVSDHIAEYATLKAMGYSNFYLSKVVLQEAFVLAILGFIPGFVACIGLYAMTRNATRLPLDMTLERGLQVLVLTIIMCVVSGAISLRKVQSADPAEIFG
jgi:putative ABC transport system permease protein